MTSLKNDIQAFFLTLWKLRQRVLCLGFFPSSDVLIADRPSSAGKWVLAKLNKPAALSKMKSQLDL